MESQADIQNLMSIIVLVLMLMVFALFFLIQKLSKRLLELKKQVDYLDANQWEKATETEDQKLKRTKFRAQSHLKSYVFIGGEPIETEVRNISRTGVLIRSIQTVLEVGKTYAVQIELDAQSLIKTEVKVVRQLDEGTQYGCSFQNISMNDVKKITTYVSGQAIEDLK